MTWESKVNWKEERENLIKLGEQGKTMQQIAKIYGCSRQRVKQILTREVPNWGEIYGKAVRDKEAQAAFENLQSWRVRKWGTLDKSNVEDLYWIQRDKFNIKRSNAKREGWKWDLEFGDLVWPTHCPILGIELDYYVMKRTEASPSFDQIIPGKGYIVGNVQVISWRANRIKNDGTWEEHQKIADHMKQFAEISGNSSRDVL